MKTKELYKRLNELLKDYEITKEECYYKTGYEYDINNYILIKMELERRFS